MAKVLVVYHSMTGSCQGMAELIANGAGETGAEVTVKKADETTPEDLLRTDAVIMGSPTYYGGMAWQLKKLLDGSVKYHGKLTGKVAAAFSSAANIGGGNETTILNILHALLIHGMVVGGIVQGDHYGPVSIGLPDDRAKNQCLKLGQEVAELAVKLGF